MKSWQRRLWIGAGILLGFLVFVWLGLYAMAFYYRWEAARFCNVVEQAQVGKTTREEYAALLHPMAWRLDWVTCDPGDCTEAFGVANRPKWTVSVFSGRLRWIDDHFLIPAIYFMALPQFRNGVLVGLRLEEMQGEGHPFNASVDEVMQSSETNKSILGENFTGYRAMRSFYRDGRVWHYNVRLDERASSEQRRRALDFRFQCFTSFVGCYDARRFLDPVPDADVEYWR